MVGVGLQADLFVGLPLHKAIRSCAVGVVVQRIGTNLGNVGVAKDVPFTQAGGHERVGFMGFDMDGGVVEDEYFLNNGKSVVGGGEFLGVLERPFEGEFDISGREWLPIVKIDIGA